MLKGEYTFCPTCGQPTKFRTSPEWLLGHFSGKFAGVLAALIQARRVKRGLSIEELADAAYEAVNKKPPVNAITVIRTAIIQNREKLMKLGWTILGPRDTHNGFWLVPIEPG